MNWKAFWLAVAATLATLTWGFTMLAFLIWGLTHAWRTISCVAAVAASCISVYFLWRQFYGTFNK